MIIVWALSWWYGAGWKMQLTQLQGRLASSYDYFSIGLLLKTLFNPFRQISAGKISGPLNIRWRAFIDRQISRVIGAFVRLMLVVIGSVWLVVLTILSGAWIVIWSILPIMPVIGFVLMLSGWVPTWI